MVPLAQEVPRAAGQVFVRCRHVVPPEEGWEPGRSV